MHLDIALSRLQNVGAVRLLIAIGPGGLPPAAQTPLVEREACRWTGARAFGEGIIEYWVFGAEADVERFAAVAKLLGGVGRWIAELAGRPEIDWSVLDETTGTLYSGAPVDVEHPERRWAHVEDATTLTLVAIKDLGPPPAPNPSADPPAPKQPASRKGPGKADEILKIVVKVARDEMADQKILPCDVEQMLVSGIFSRYASQLREIVNGKRPLWDSGPRFDKRHLPNEWREKPVSLAALEGCDTYKLAWARLRKDRGGQGGAAGDVPQEMGVGKMVVERPSRTGPPKAPPAEPDPAANGPREDELPVREFRRSTTYTQSADEVEAIDEAIDAAMDLKARYSGRHRP